MRVKAKILKGYSRRKVARQLGMAETTVRRIVVKLVALNELKPIPGTVNPVIYDDPRVCTTFGPQPASEKSVQNATSVKKKHIPFKNHGPDEVRVHLKGYIRFVVHSVGNYDIVRDIQNVVMAEWGKTSYPKGRVDRYGLMLALGGGYKFAHRHGNDGSETLAFWPQDKYVHENYIEKGKVALIDRARYLADLLKPYGWVLSEPEVRGKFHYARNNLAMVEVYQKVTPSDDTEVEVDTSPDEPEFETFSPEDDHMMNHLPSTIRGIQADIGTHDDEIKALRDLNKGLCLEILRKENFLLERELSNKEAAIRNKPQAVQPVDLWGVYL